MKGPKYDFDGKVALITGAGSGIGRVVADAFARNGATVIVADLNVQGGEQTVRCIEDNGGAAVFVRTDVTSELDVRKAVTFAADRYGRLDFANNNAGIEGGRAPLAEYPGEIWDKTLAVNLTGVYRCMRYELQQMLQQGFGAIVNTASVAGLVGIPERAAYVASKHGVIGLTKGAALEVSAKGIRVNAVAPGIINAGLTDQAPKEFKDMAVAAHPIGRMGEAEEVASAVIWLCSDHASFVVGQTLALDGGFTIH